MKHQGQWHHIFLEHHQNQCSDLMSGPGVLVTFSQDYILQFHSQSPMHVGLRVTVITGQVKVKALSKKGHSLLNKAPSKSWC